MNQPHRRDPDDAAHDRVMRAIGTTALPKGFAIMATPDGVSQILGPLGLVTYESPEHAARIGAMLIAAAVAVRDGTTNRSGVPTEALAFAAAVVGGVLGGATLEQLTPGPKP